MNFGCVFGNHSWSEIKNRRQSCLKCNQIRTIDCNHIWIEYQTLEKTHYGTSKGYIYVRKCQNCGELKNFGL